MKVYVRWIEVSEGGVNAYGSGPREYTFQATTLMDWFCFIIMTVIDVVYM